MRIGSPASDAVSLPFGPFLASGSGRGGGAFARFAGAARGRRSARIAAPPGPLHDQLVAGVDPVAVLDPEVLFPDLGPELPVAEVLLGNLRQPVAGDHGVNRHVRAGRDLRGGFPRGVVPVGGLVERLRRRTVLFCGDGAREHREAQKATHRHDQNRRTLPRHDDLLKKFGETGSAA